MDHLFHYIENVHELNCRLKSQWAGEESSSAHGMIWENMQKTISNCKILITYSLICYFASIMLQWQSRSVTIFLPNFHTDLILHDLLKLLSRSCWCGLTGHQMSLCEHMACWLLLGPCALLSIVCPLSSRYPIIVSVAHLCLPRYPRLSPYLASWCL